MRTLLPILLLLLAIYQPAFSQFKELYPDISVALDLSAAGESAHLAKTKPGQDVMDKLSTGVKFNTLTQAEKDALAVYEEAGEYWDIIKEGASWHDVGGPSEITASSSLGSQGANSYAAGNAGDLNYKTAWVEGVKGFGKGEYLLYTFEAIAPRITEITVVNGYIKSQRAWQNNSRVKKLRVWYDDKPYAILNLRDIRGEQVFELEKPLGRDKEGVKYEDLEKQPNWTLKFEIMEVYPGAKYDDVAITEIYFDGIDVYCFAAGTPVLMANGQDQAIETLQVGDSVMFLTSQNTVKKASILQLEQEEHENLVEYHFADGSSILCTRDHPFRLKNGQWASLLPQQSGQYHGMGEIEQLEIGQIFQTIDANGELEETTLKAIVRLPGTHMTYTISRLSEGNNFIANGRVVGVERLAIN